MLGGANNSTKFSQLSTIVGGFCNSISAENFVNRIQTSSIIGGCNNTTATASHSSSIVGGNLNLITNCSERSSIVGSYKSSIDCSKGSAIIGGCGNTMYKSDCSVVLGGVSVDFNLCSGVVFAPSLMTSTFSCGAQSDKAWRLGGAQSGSVALCTSMYVEISINGQVYKLGIVS
jgi:hypothetical protein